MQQFPIFMRVADAIIIVSGAGDVAVPKLRLLLKTRARIRVFGTEPDQRVRQWARQGRLVLIERRLSECDVENAKLVYAANGDETEDSRVADLARRGGALANIVDNLHASDFLTPAIVDRDPVTVAIGTEGTAPVLARRIKASIESMLPSTTGRLARMAASFRNKAERLEAGLPRRRFWNRFFENGAAVLQSGHADRAETILGQVLQDSLSAEAEPGRVSIVGAGPGDPELLTLKARNVLHEADVVVHDRLVPAAILELARREAEIVEVGKTPGGPAWAQADIDDLLVQHALAGAHVVRLKSGDPGVYGRLDEEMDALDAAAIPFEIVPGVTSAMAAAATMKVSLTRRRRNSSIRFITGHDIDGFAEQDWRGLSRPGAVAAIYMGRRAALFLRGRLIMHGARADVPVTAVENASRSDQRIISTTLEALPDALADAELNGPTILFLGLSPRGLATIVQGQQNREEALA